MHNIGEIAALWLYPVKALAGVAVTQARLTYQGLEGDRRWMLIDAQQQCVTQRLYPALVLIQPQYQQNQWWLTAPNMPPIPLVPPSANSPLLEVTLWRDTCLAHLGSPALTAWLDQALGQSLGLRLAYFAAEHPRTENTARFGQHSHTHFADAAPFLVAQQASLHAYNTALAAAGLPAVDMRRFRPNMVLTGGKPFEEHQWRRLSTENGACLGLIDHCQRCSVVTVNPDTGVMDAGAIRLNALAAINAMPSSPKAPAFGVNAVLQAGQGLSLQQGQAVVWA